MKKVIIAISIIALLIIVLLFTNFGKTLLVYSPFFKEKVFFDMQDELYIKYTNLISNEEKYVKLIDKSEINEIINILSNKKYTNYTSIIGLEFLDGYTIYFNNGIEVIFDNSSADSGYAKIKTEKNKVFLTKIDTRVINKVIELFY